MNDIFKIGIKRYVCHAELVRLRNAKGLSQPECAEYLEMPVNKYRDIEKLQRYPTENEAQLIADCLDGNVYTLFPKWAMPIFGTRSTYKVVEISPLQLDSREILALADPREIEIGIRREMNNAIEKPLAGLKIREKKVIEMRFGLNDESQSTLSEIAEEIKTSKSRVGQIEAKAIRKLRHPSFAKPMRDCVIGNVGFHSCLKDYTKDEIDIRKYWKKLHNIKKFSKRILTDLIEEGKGWGLDRARILYFYNKSYREYKEYLREEREKHTIVITKRIKGKNVERKKVVKDMGIYVYRKWESGRLIEQKDNSETWYAVKNAKGEDIVGKKIDGKWITNG
jgi:RNA polymerase sigma factor (sigma-70 family)